MAGTVHSYTSIVCQLYKGRFIVDNYDRYQEAFFSRIVNQFLAQQCDIAPEKKTAGRVLFHRFRDYWNEVTHGAKHPALLGQLRVELTELGFASSGGKWPRWYGLSLRKKKQIKAKAPKTYHAPVSTDSEIYRAITGESLIPGPAYC